MKNSISFVACIVLVVGMPNLLAQGFDPNSPDNPTGNTGALKAQITTGGSYDAHSGNGTRTVTDLEVPGALGVYGLDFTRYWNSVPIDADDPNVANPIAFGASGWSHSWEWSAVYSYQLAMPIPETGHETATRYSFITITFPDGHITKYHILRYGAQPGGQQVVLDDRHGPPYSAAEANWTGPAYVHDRLREMASDGSSFWLHLADGGSVYFKGTSWVMDSGARCWSYQAQEVFDPHGLRTDLHYNPQGELDQVTQEGGRYLRIIWGNHNGLANRVIDRVETHGPAGSQAVVYNYNGFPNATGPFLTLTSVNYPEGASAIYTYGNYFGDDPNSANTSSPLLKIANDPRYAGAMTRIFYTYRGSTCPEKPPTCYECLHKYFRATSLAIRAEKSAGHLDPSGYNVTVSSFAIDCLGGTRTETSGLGAWRKFYFGDSAGGPGPFTIMAYQLAKRTDFTTTTSGDLPFEWQNWKDGQPRQIWDGRGIQTDAIVTPGDASGQPGEIHHVTADGSYQIFDRVNPGSSLARDPTRIHNPYNHWLFSKTDERNQKTTYTRDERRRVNRIDYPGGSFETFNYNIFNQVTSHRLPSGAIKTYIYDYGASPPTRGLLTKEYNSEDYALHGTSADIEYTYDEFDRVKTKKDGRARIKGKEFSVSMNYNGRHQVIREEYPATNGGANPFKTYGYDPYGNCTSITNELGEQSFYTYDNYRRCTSYTEPLNAPDWKGAGSVPSRTWNWTYDRVGPNNASISAMAHTSKEWRLQIEPPYDAAGNRRAKVRHYDYNNLLVFEYDSVIQAPNGAWTYPADAAMHSYTYDENGQKKTCTDPLSRLTTYDYDFRNRLWKTNETVNTIPRTTETLYDETGNKTDVTFPDGQSQHWRYHDAFGQPRQFIDERNNVTDLHYWPWGPMKKLAQVITHREKDGGGMEDQRTEFYYDLMGRAWATVFPDGSTEWSSYEFGQLKTWRTRKGQEKTINYDARGREISHSWYNDAAPAISRSWDNASRLTSISNLYSIINYTYDDAGQVITEGNTITGASAGPRQTTYWRYPNGVTAHITYPNGWRGRRDYTARGQLQTTGADNASGAWTYKLGQYTYLTDGKVQTETGLNGVATGYLYDGRGQTRVTHTLRVSTTPTQRYSYRTYTRDERDRILAWSKSNSPTYNLLENGRGDRYGYDEEGQLTAASYEALTPAGTPTGAKRTESFFYDALGNRQGVNQLAGRGATTFTRTDNGLNQYTRWTPSVINYDDDINGSPGNGVLMQENTITAFYNAINQPTTIFGGTLSTGMNFGFDPLGRCVKRWVSASGAATTNPATYLYYDGWNLIQEGTGAAAAERIYLQGNRVDGIACHYNYAAAQWRYHHYDARGHCILLTDPSGDLVEQYEYDAFGKPYFYNGSGTPLPNGSAVGNRFLFTGREWLSDVKLYDYRNRLYQPELGRFLQPDPIQFKAGDYNLYRYCHNDPVNNSDPTGLGYDEEMVTSDPVARNEIISAVNAQAARAWEQFQSDTLEMLQNPSSWVGPGRIGMARGPRGPLNSLLGKIFPSFRKDAILASLAGPRTGNFGLGSATRAEATSLGRTWVGNSFRVASDGKTLVSRDGLRQYRPPSFKPQLNKIQANFEQRPTPEGPWKRNGHLDITD